MPHFRSYWRSRYLHALGVLAIALLPACGEVRAQPGGALQNEIRTVIERGVLPELRRPEFSVHAKSLDRLYAARSHVPAWFERGHPRPLPRSRTAETGAVTLTTLLRSPRPCGEE